MQAAHKQNYGRIGRKAQLRVNIGARRLPHLLDVDAVGNQKRRVFQAQRAVTFDFVSSQRHQARGIMQIGVLDETQKKSFFGMFGD